ncbi:DUF898 family protein [Halomonas sp. ML-15]|uniref:DUF898 family protein n=1 Tax=Halomonas sp. ML-15 TaxID=2773305 RepID=UPI0017473713|nr:DUF898 family protein [Halomonas sp. ML-15]MBD3895356.1 DUF898 family protein [Halomonas sp. ML-15]
MSSTEKITAGYDGQTGKLLKISLVTSLLTVLTIGIYRFWAKTRIRRFLLSSISVNGDRFEYTGTGLEKLKGFFIALIVVAVYLSIVQLLLFFFNLSMFRRVSSEVDFIIMTASFYLNLVFLAPLIFFAQYRARRYKMARTRFRGIRFGMEPGAWGYSVRVIGHGLLTLISLGLLLPRQTYWLEKYQTDRTWYGQVKFHQSGSWTQLYSAMRHIFIGLGLALLSGLAMALSKPTLGTIVFVIATIWWSLGVMYYKVKSFQYLTNTKVLGDEVHFSNNLTPSSIITMVILGSLGASIITLLCILLLAGPIGALIWQSDISTATLGMLSIMLPPLAYISAFILIGALMLVMVVQPVISHIVQHTTVLHLDSLESINQRAPDLGTDAEGFADVLDVGATV